MAAPCAPGALDRVCGAFDRWIATVSDTRLAAVRARPRTLIDALRPGAVALSVGGGPGRFHRALVNVNIAHVPGVDVVGDAHALPYADASVQMIFCEAVLEHVADPPRAVAEMFRVLAPGGRAFAVTPFLAAYHAYPAHFQNFTLEGHEALFRRAGFAVVASGACVGPAQALCDLVVHAARLYTPTRTLRAIVPRALLLVSCVVRQLDRVLLRSRHAAHLCATTYVEAERPFPEVRR